MTNPTSRSGWQIGEHATHDDPLLDALVLLTRIHGNPFTPEALSAGLPLVDHRLTPSLLPRAAARAQLTARIVRKPLAEITPNFLPALLLLHDRRACLLLERLPDGACRVRFPEAGESVDVLSADELAARYTGLVCFVRPRFRFEARAPEIRSLRGQHWFWGTVLDNWRLYRDTLLAALVINLFALAIPLFSMTVYDRVVPNRAVETLWVLAVGTALLLCFDFALRTLRAYIVDTAGKRIDVQLSARIMERVLGLRMEARPASVGSFAANLRAFEGVRDFIASATVTTLIDLPFVL
ncbi:MAG TPA: type I secretion system permease/ATPase, partial [Rhodocyclaceae bacterium]|nr:type I secretion system permease/ATPase [Rhodocyclaceae bacterium]